MRRSVGSTAFLLYGYVAGRRKEARVRSLSVQR
jgi:hypothetical protein